MERPFTHFKMGYRMVEVDYITDALIKVKKWYGVRTQAVSFSNPVKGSTMYVVYARYNKNNIGHVVFNINHVQHHDKDYFYDYTIGQRLFVKDMIL